MNYPNAYAGVKKIRTAEILSIIVALCVGVAGGFAAAASKADAGSDAYTGLMLAAAAPLAAAGVLSIISFILNLVGLNKAGKDESAFKTGFLFAVLGIVASVLASAFSKNALLNSIASSVGKVLEMMIMLMVIQGIRNLASLIGDREVYQKGKNLLSIICIMYIIILVVTVASGIFGKNDTTTMIYGILSMVAAVLSIVVLFTYLSYLKKAVRMLEK